jgi:peptidoglycan/LPS O-acetylase OafA/YrhL
MAAVFCHHLYDAGVTGGFLSAAVAGGPGQYTLDMLRMSVDAFFLLSGLLIPAVLVRQGSASRFLLNRAVRIYPTFLVPHLLIFMIGPLISHKWLADLSPGEYLRHFVANLLLLPGIFDLPIAQGVAWTLSYEAAFYVFAASALTISQWQTHRVVRGAAAGAWLAAALGTLQAHPQGWYFVAGAAVWYFERDAGHRVLCTNRSSLAGLAAMALMCITYDPALPVSLVCGCVALRTLAHEEGLLAWLLRARLLEFLADISYSFYLWHPIVMFVTKRLFGYQGGLLAHPGLNFAVFSLVTLALSLIIACLSYRLLEQRCTAWLQALLTRPALAIHARSSSWAGLLPRHTRA